MGLALLQKAPESSGTSRRHKNAGVNNSEDVEASCTTHTNMKFLKGVGGEKKGGTKNGLWGFSRRAPSWFNSIGLVEKMGERKRRRG